MPGVVRLGARWYDESGAVVRSADWGPLPGPMWPGDHAVVDLDLNPVDADGRLLPPGRYTLGLDLFQAELGWFGEAGDEPLRLEVELS